MRQKCIPETRNANMLCCINRCTVRDLGKMVILLFLTILWRYLLSFPQFCPASTRGVTGRQARAGSLTRLRACMGKGWGKRVFSAWRRLRIRTNYSLPQPKVQLQKRQNQGLLTETTVTISSEEEEENHHQNGKHQNRCPEIQHKIHPQRFSKFHWSAPEWNLV